MKSTLKLSLAAMLLGLSVANLLRAADDAAPAQSGPSIQSEPSTPPDAGEKPQHPHTMNPQRILQRLSDQVNLTDDQKAKILPLLQAQADQLAALHNDTSLSDDEKHQKMHAIMQSTHEQIGAVLTPEQNEKFKSMRGGHGDHGSKGDGNPPPPAPPPST